MRNRTTIALLMLVVLITLLPAAPVIAVGPVTNWPWLGTYPCTQGYHPAGVFGLDFGLDHVQLYAAGPGKVYSTFTTAPDYPDETYNGGWGNEVIIQHPDGYYTRYAHLSSVLVSPGQEVTGQGASLGTPIGVSGNSGRSSGPHLHFEVYRYGRAPSNSVEPGPISGYNNPITCPGSYTNYIGITLFDLPNYDPDGSSLTIESTGFFNLPSWFNDKASSVDLFPDWVVRVYKHAYGDGGYKTYYQSDPDFSDDYFDNKPWLSVNNRVSSVNVYYGICLAGTVLSFRADGTPDQCLPPSTPAPTSTPGSVPTPTHTPTATPTPDPYWWLLEFSKAEKPPLEVDIHIQVQWTSDFDAFRLCFDGTNCQETSATELFYTWNTYGWSDGHHALTIQYRRLSDGGDWNSALRYDEQYYLSPNRSDIAPCDGGDGAYLKSGADCIRLTASQRDLAPIGWSDRSDLVIAVLGPYEAWVYDDVDYQGNARLVKSGEEQGVGSNVSSVKLEPASSPPPPLPTDPFTCDSQTVSLYHFNEGSGSTVNDACGRVNGIKDGAVSWTAGKFENALRFPNPPDGRGVDLGAPAAFDLCPMTVQLWLRRVGEGRIAGQLGGGGNTGQNKWLLAMLGSRIKLEIWSAGGSQWATSYKDIFDTDWHLVMFTYDCANTGKLYLDNELVGTVTTAGVWPSGRTTFEIGSGEGISRFNGEIDEVRISNVIRVPEPPPAPVADFAASPTSGSPPLPVNFTDQSTGSIISWYWDFGDGSTSTVQNPSHYYNPPGDYTVSSTVTGPGGSDTETKSAFIHVSSPPTPTATRTPTPTGTPTPADTENPVAYWISPVGNEQVHRVGSEAIQLEVGATDNEAVPRVRFYRWDAVNEWYVGIGEDTTAPYLMSLEASTLDYDWNQIFANAYDTAGNESDRKWIWLYRDRPTPTNTPTPTPIATPTPTLIPSSYEIYLPIILKNYPP